MGSTGCMSLTPVTLAEGAWASVTRPAPTGSVTAEKTIGVVVMALTRACELGVATPRIRSRFSPANFCAMVDVVGKSAWAFCRS